MVRKGKWEKLKAELKAFTRKTSLMRFYDWIKRLIWHPKKDMKKLDEWVRNRLR